ncbi:MAG: hypothetical protein IKB01_01805 [Lachnospiraceae bacterium]|nr:hypothetical protein [Lachnospiraceae bacterium]
MLIVFCLVLPYFVMAGVLIAVIIGITHLKEAQKERKMNFVAKPELNNEDDFIPTAPDYLKAKATIVRAEIHQLITEKFPGAVWQFYMTPIIEDAKLWHVLIIKDSVRIKEDIVLDKQNKYAFLSDVQKEKEENKRKEEESVTNKVQKWLEENFNLIDQKLQNALKNGNKFFSIPLTDILVQDNSFISELIDELQLRDFSSVDIQGNSIKFGVPQTVTP